MKKSSIHDGLGWCSHVYSSLNVTFDNNVFYNCEKFLTRALYSNYFTYTNNLLIASRERKLNPNSDLYDMVAGLDMYIPTMNAQYKIQNNLVQGTEGNGFVMSGTGCGDPSGFKFNQVNSAKYMGLIIAANNSLCLEAGDISIAKTQGAVWSNFDASGLNIKRMILAENDKGTQVMFGRENDDNAFNYDSVVFIALARPKCSYCYSDPSFCSGQEAIDSAITVIAGKARPLDKPTPFGLTSICKDAAFDQKLFIRNCFFINYKTSYESDSNPNFKQCKNNVILQQRNMEPDAHANVYLSSSTVVNSESNSFARMVEFYEGFMFWRGGCGDFNCTGEKNWIITDVDGSFLGQPGQIIPNNRGINLANSTCTSKPLWNARWCTGIRYGTLEFQNDGADQRTRLIAPLNLTFGSSLTTLNQWREWKWEGPEPLNMRLSRFSGIIELNSTVTMKFETTVPEELKFKLQKGRSDVDYAIVKIYYERPNRVEVWNLMNGTFVKPYRVDQNVDLSTKINECGANIYDPDQRTIQFVITNNQDCKLKVRTVNSVKVSLRMDSTIEDFYSNDGEALFVDKIAAFLNIDASRIRIVNVLKGSVIVNFDVVENKNLTNSTSALVTENPPPMLSMSPLMTAAPSDYQNIGNTNEKTKISVVYTSSEEENLNNVKTELEGFIKKLELGLKSGELNLPAKFKSIQNTLVISNHTKHGDKNRTNNTNDSKKKKEDKNKNKTEDTKRKLTSMESEKNNDNIYSDVYQGITLICILVLTSVATYVYFSRRRENKKGTEVANIYF